MFLGFTCTEVLTGTSVQKDADTPQSLLRQNQGHTAYLLSNLPSNETRCEIKNRKKVKDKRLRFIIKYAIKLRRQSVYFFQYLLIS